MTSVDLSKIKHNRKLIETLIRERDSAGRVSDEQLRLQLLVLYLQKHPFKNLWNWLMGRQ